MGRGAMRGRLGGGGVGRDGDGETTGMVMGMGMGMGTGSMAVLGEGGARTHIVTSRLLVIEMGEARMLELELERERERERERDLLVGGMVGSVGSIGSSWERLGMKGRTGKMMLRLWWMAGEGEGRGGIELW